VVPVQYAQVRQWCAEACVRRVRATRATRVQAPQAGYEQPMEEVRGKDEGAATSAAWREEER